MLRSRLFLKTFVTIIAGVLLYTGGSYLSSVPWIRDTVQQQEERTGRVVLDNVYEMARNAHSDIEAWRESALEARRRELRYVVQVAIGALERIEREVEAQDLSPDEARQRILEDLRHLTYGRDGYVFIADYDSQVISHPDPELHGADLSEQQDVHGNLIVPPMVEGAREHGEGFYTYWWRRLGEEEPSEKLTYYKHLPEREWVINTGIYVDDVEEEVVRRQEAVVERLRRHLHQTRIANTGYLYIFDSDFNMLIHPNSNIEGTNFSDLLNPSTGQPIGEDLVEATHLQDGKLVYKWDKPSVPGNYVHDKIAWSRYLPGFDWYIASSVYIDEFRDTANTLTVRMVTIAGIALLLAIIGAYIFLYRLIVPITRLAQTASRVGDGDLSAKTDIRRNDEIGVLASTFNTMVDRLRDQIDNMERRVEERTAKLDRTVHDLEARNHEQAEINQMGELLQSCRREEEIFTIAAQTGRTLFPSGSGRIYMPNEEGKLQLVAQWGEVASTEVAEAAEDAFSCWVVRRSQLHRDPADCNDSLCPHCCEPGVSSLCVPLLAEGAVIGVIKLNQRSEDSDMDHTLNDHEPLMATIADHVALSVTNLRLRERLRQQSIKDPLTGLFNRRRLEEALANEISRASRHGGQVGVIMLDVDHFKGFNDTYGHELGDAVLREVGNLLRHNVRQEDIPCRYGGEEFTLVIPDANHEGLHILAENIRTSIERNIAPALETEIVDRVTVSIGIALYPEHGDTVHGLLKAADTALYLAKEGGRNRVVDANPLEHPH